MAVKEIFPTPVWVVDLRRRVHEPLNASLLSTIEELISPRQPIPIGSTWQSDPVLHTLDGFREFTSIVCEAAQGIIAFLDLDAGAFEITGCWANINPTGALNSNHCHPNNFLSGVYYVSVPKGTGRIEFADPRPQAAVIFPPVKRWNRFNGNKVTLEAKEGRLIIFPAWLSHSVPVNRGRHERVSLSFNIMFSSFTETMSKPLWQGTAPIRTAGATDDRPE